MELRAFLRLGFKMEDQGGVKLAVMEGIVQCPVVLFRQPVQNFQAQAVDPQGVRRAGHSPGSGGVDAADNQAAGLEHRPQVNSGGFRAAFQSALNAVVQNVGKGAAQVGVGHGKLGGDLGRDGQGNPYLPAQAGFVLENRVRHQVVAVAGTHPVLAIYDGRDLYYGHAGDDGIVVQTRDGEVEMVTARLKGEEASSVYPLQSGEAMWHFGKSAKPVAAFVMATDGVLDAFVTNREDYYGVNYCKGVCYAFMEEAVYTLGKKEPNTPKEALDKYLDYLKSPAYRAAVTDDLTLAAVVSREQLAAGKHPRFSMQIWNTVQEESRAARRRLLNHKAPLDAGPGDLFEPLVEETPRRPAPEPEPPVQPDRAQGRTPERTPDRERPGWYIPVTILLVLLLAGAALIGGIALGRLYFPKIAPEEYSAAVRQRDDLARQAETLTQEKEALEETLTQLEDALEQSRAECAASAEQTAQLQEEAAALRQQLEDLEARYAETEETPE